MSLCDTCIKPGACCRGLGLHNSEGSLFFETPLHALVAMASYGLPFLPVDSWYDHYAQADWWADNKARIFTYNCPALDADGRCSIYENRPQLCRDYQPGSDPLCVMHKPLEPYCPDRPTVP